MWRTIGNLFWSGLHTFHKHLSEPYSKSKSQGGYYSPLLKTYLLVGIFWLGFSWGFILLRYPSILPYTFIVEHSIAIPIPWLSPLGVYVFLSWHILLLWIVRFMLHSTAVVFSFSLLLFTYLECITILVEGGSILRHITPLFCQIEIYCDFFTSYIWR